MKQKRINFIGGNKPLKLNLKALSIKYSKLGPHQSNSRRLMAAFKFIFLRFVAVQQKKNNGFNGNKQIYFIFSKLSARSECFFFLMVRNLSIVGLLFP